MILSCSFILVPSDACIKQRGLSEELGHFCLELKNQSRATVQSSKGMCSKLINMCWVHPWWMVVSESNNDSVFRLFIADYLQCSSIYIRFINYSSRFTNYSSRFINYSWLIIEQPMLINSRAAIEVLCFVGPTAVKDYTVAIGECGWQDALWLLESMREVPWWAVEGTSGTKKSGNNCILTTAKTHHNRHLHLHLHHDQHHHNHNHHQHQDSHLPVQ